MVIAILHTSIEYNKFNRQHNSQCVLNTTVVLKEKEN